MIVNGLTKSLTERVSTGNPLIIAGPCSAESPEQLLDVAKALRADGRTHYFRAGVWKPRTSPGTFQGVGAEALKWMAMVKRETGLPVATEVANERHVYEALKHGVDLLWIGARTVSNPFTVQEIAEAIRGVDIPVLVKNPLSPDVDLWEGAINRFARVGITQLGAIHRGFSWWGKSIFRNQPYWSIPSSLKERMPNLPIICDPSHIAGRRNLVPIIAQRGLEQGLNGLMVEVHPSPEHALSDSQQQLTPDSFAALLSALQDTQHSFALPEELLAELRSEVDSMDDLLIWALANRMELSEQIANIKRTNSLPILQQVRWNQVLSRVVQQGGGKGLRPVFVKRLFSSIHKESCLVQQALVQNKPAKSEKQVNFISSK